MVLMEDKQQASILDRYSNMCQSDPVSDGIVYEEHLALPRRLAFPVANGDWSNASED
jgi:hypothetical protein